MTKKKDTGKVIRKGKQYSIREASPDHPVYTRNTIYISPVSKRYPIGTFTLDASMLSTGTQAGRATLDLIRMLDGPDTLDPIGEYIVLNELPLERETYLALAYPDGMPEDWGPEDEAKIPEVFRDDYQPDGEE